MNRQRLSALYLGFQSLAAAAWWLGILGNPPFRRFFLAPGAPDATLFAFLGADALLFIGGSAVSAFFLVRSHPLRKPVLWLTAGAVSYATLYTLGLGLLTGAGWLGAVPMTAAMLVTVFIAWRCS